MLKSNRSYGANGRVLCPLSKKPICLLLVAGVPGLVAILWEGAMPGPCAGRDALPGSTCESIRGPAGEEHGSLAGGWRDDGRVGSTGAFQLITPKIQAWVETA